MMIVLGDAGVGSWFCQFLDGSYISGDLDMIVTEDSYWERLKEVWKLNQRVRMVFMSARLVGSLMKVYEEKMLVKDVIIICEENDKGKTGYSN